MRIILNLILAFSLISLFQGCVGSSGSSGSSASSNAVPMRPLTYITDGKLPKPSVDCGDSSCM